MQIQNLNISIVSIYVGLERHPAAVDDPALDTPVADALAPSSLTPRPLWRERKKDAEEVEEEEEEGEEEEERKGAFCNANKQVAISLLRKPMQTRPVLAVIGGSLPTNGWLAPF